MKPHAENPSPLTLAQLHGHEPRPLSPHTHCPDCGKLCELRADGRAHCNGIKNGDYSHDYGLTFVPSGHE